MNCQNGGNLKWNSPSRRIIAGISRAIDRRTRQNKRKSLMKTLQDSDLLKERINNEKKKWLEVRVWYPEAGSPWLV